MFAPKAYYSRAETKLVDPHPKLKLKQRQGKDILLPESDWAVN